MPRDVYYFLGSAVTSNTKLKKISESRELPKYYSQVLTEAQRRQQASEEDKSEKLELPEDCFL